MADNAILDHARLEKVKYYNQESIRKWICDRGNCNQTVFLGVAWNWRGAMPALSANRLLAMGLTKKNLGVLTVRVLELGYRIYAFFKGSTHRVARYQAHKGGNEIRYRSGTKPSARARRRKPPTVGTCTWRLIRRMCMRPTRADEPGVGWSPVIVGRPAPGELKRVIARRVHGEHCPSARKGIHGNKCYARERLQLILTRSAWGLSIVQICIRRIWIQIRNKEWEVRVIRYSLLNKE